MNMCSRQKPVLYLYTVEIDVMESSIQWNQEPLIKKRERPKNYLCVYKYMKWNNI